MLTNTRIFTIESGKATRVQIPKAHALALNSIINPSDGKLPPLPMSEMGGVIWRWSKVGCVHARPFQCIHAAMGPTNSSNRRHFHGRSARPVPSRFRADREGSAGQGWYCDGTGMAVRRNRNRTATEPKRPCDGTPFPPPSPPFTQESNLCSESTENDPLFIT